MSSLVSAYSPFSRKWEWQRSTRCRPPRLKKESLLRDICHHTFDSTPRLLPRTRRKSYLGKNLIGPLVPCFCRADSRQGARFLSGMHMYYVVTKRRYFDDDAFKLITLVLMRHMAFIAHDPEDWKEISTGMPPTCASKSSFSANKISSVGRQNNPPSLF